MQSSKHESSYKDNKTVCLVTLASLTLVLRCTSLNRINFLVDSEVQPITTKSAV